MSKKQLAYTLWIEKYRPETISQVLLPTNLKTYFLDLVKQKDIPHLLFVSAKPGCGKTSVAKALANDIKADYIYINTSSDGGIDTLRTRIAKFATSYSFMNDNVGGKKICILDEFDGSTPDLQKALRAFMEEFQDSCRFILTCNYITKIIEPIQSRCQIINFNMTDNDTQKELKPLIIQRLSGILKFEKVEFDEKTLEKLVEKFYPDIRKMIGLLYQYSKMNKCIDNNIFNFEKVDMEFYDLLLKKKLTLARKFVIEKNYNYDEMYRNLFDNFVPLLDKNLQGQAIIIISEFMFRSSTVIDKEINFTACMLELIGII